MDWIPWHKRSAENAAAFRKTQRESRARYRAAHEEEINRKKREDRAANPEKEAARMRAHRERYKEKYQAQKKEYYEQNKGRYRTHNRVRNRRMAMPTLWWQWLPQIEEFYREARRRTDESGILHVVDHIWPISGKGSCGLNVPWNLRVVTQYENDSKGNKPPNESVSSVIINIQETHYDESGQCVYDLRCESEPRGPKQQYL